MKGGLSPNPRGLTAEETKGKMTTQQAEVTSEVIAPVDEPLEKPAAPARTLADSDTELASTRQALEKAQNDLKAAQGRNKPAD